MNHGANANNYKMTVTAALAGVLFFFSGTAFAASAEQENLNSLLQSIAEKVAEISAIAENPDLSPKEKELEETRVRKEVLFLAFDLTLLEDEGLENKLNSLSDLNDDQGKIRENLLVIFTENENAYAEMRKRLDEAVTLEEVKSLANDFKVWRSAVYNPKVEKVVSFILIFRQKQILSVAWQRLDKIKSDLEKLKNAGLINGEETDGLLKGAMLNLETAQELNRRAEEALSSILAEELDPLKAPSTGLEKEESPASPRELVEQSLESTRSAYGNFIEIAMLVKEKLNLK